jgi:hypothetical protein
VIRDFVKRRHGVYALFHHGNVYYVGLASNLRSRLRSHLEDRHANRWDSFSVYLTIDKVNLRPLESLVLRIASPGGNKVQGRISGAEDLKRRFARAIAKHQKDEREDLFETWSEKEAKRDSERPRKGAGVLARYIDRPMSIRLQHAGKLYKAHVRKDGLIRFKGRLIASPSRAASLVKRRPWNGWTAWLYERAPGDWMPLDNLRR